MRHSLRTFHIIDPENLFPGKYDFNYPVNGIKEVTIPEFQTMFSEEIVKTLTTGYNDDDYEEKFETEFRVRGRYILEILGRDIIQAWSWNSKTQQFIPSAITQSDIYEILDSVYTDDEQLLMIPQDRYFAINNTYTVEAINIQDNISLNDLLLFCRDINAHFTIDLTDGNRTEYKNLNIHYIYRYFDGYYSILQQYVYFQNNLIFDNTSFDDNPFNDTSFDDNLLEYNKYVFKLPITNQIYDFVEKLLLIYLPKVITNNTILYL